MPIRVTSLKLSIDEDEHRLLEKAARRLRVPVGDIRTHAITRRSLDARRSGEIGWVFSLELALDRSPSEEKRHVDRLGRGDVHLITRAASVDPQPGSEPLSHRPVIVGFGPAGLFAAYRLALCGYQPIVLERGQPVRVRHRDILLRFYRQREFDPESNLLFGEGGAGAYSDGKLYTRVNHPLVQWVMQTLYQHGANPDILIDGKPHIGSDRLPNICRRLRMRIEQLGGEVRFGTCVTGLRVDEQGQLTGVDVAGETVATRHALVAVGHSARDTLMMLSQSGVALSAKPFQLGVRIEHPQELVNRWQYGVLADDGRLPLADYQLVARGAAGEGQNVFSFCMCPGGMILPSNESAGLVVTNGASRASRNQPFANSGLVMTIHPTEFNNDPLEGLRYQKRIESGAFSATHDYAVPSQRASDFLAGSVSQGRLDLSYPLGSTCIDLRSILPTHVADSIRRALVILDQRLPGFAGPDAVLVAPETRASAPVRIDRDAQSRESVSVRGLYPVGEGAGYAGGIVSAAVDGIKSADQIIAQYAPIH